MTSNVTRRAFLGHLAIAAGVVPLTLRRSPARAQIEVPGTPIGSSQGGLPLIVYHLGDGPTRVLILGGQHGGPEANTIELAHLLLAHFVENPSELPAELTLDILPDANPDGTVAGIRQYLSGVDPNRNWGGPDWQSDAYDSNGRFRPGLGGPAPFSEQETRALADWMLQTRPALTVNYHSAGGFMFGGRDGLAGELTAAYADASGYPVPTPGGGSPLSYRATGSSNVWARSVGLNGLFIELTTPYVAEFERNLAGLRAVLPLVAAGG
ncbi:MAG: twin-arginine translocation signal domain-containing protein [Chloroflexota bacterium]|nr:twin-arginine translocation signal domain-containing protein [Chloroflexota bacterium]